MSTEATAIDHMRKSYHPFQKVQLVDWDIDRIGYQYKHFDVPSYMCEAGNTIEVWVDGHRAENLTYIKDSCCDRMTHCLIDFDTHATEAVVRYNENVTFQYHEYKPGARGSYILEMEFNDPRYLAMRDPENGVYYITMNRYEKPIVTKTDKVIRYECPYMNSIDLYMERDLVWCGDVTADKPLYIDDPMSQYTYGAFMIDQDCDAEIDTRFYPCVNPKKSGFMRVYDDKKINRPYPEYTRVINYAENLQYFSDPYHGELFTRLPNPTNAVITSDMIDNEIIEAFAAISAYSYRWYEAPIIQDIAPVYTVLSNSNPYSRAVFVKTVYHPTTDTSTEAYVSKFPYEDHKDIIFYKGDVIYDYFIEKISFRDGEAYVDKLYGKPMYVISTDYDVDELTVLKFNAKENISVDNIEPWLNKDNLLQLHRKVNRFWHNFIALTSKSADLFAPDDQVWVGSETPPTMDDHMWFELMAYVDNAVTEDNDKEIFPLILSGKEPDVTQFPSEWKNKVVHWLGDGTDITTEDAFNRILYVQGTLTDAHKNEGLVFQDASTETAFPDLVSSTKLQDLYWSEPEFDAINHNDIWMEWYATVKDHISYSSENTMVMHINENVYTIQFDEELDDLRIIAFDDIVLNFRDWDRGLHYLSVLADLQQSGLVDADDMMIFYKRLITTKDTFDPDIHRCKTFISNVVSHLQTKEENFSVIYGTNLCHQHWDKNSGEYTPPDPTKVQVGDIATEDMGKVDRTYWYFAYPDPHKIEVPKGTFLLGHDDYDAASKLQMYKRFLLVQNDPSDIYLDELILQQIRGSEVIKHEHEGLYDRNKYYSDDQPFTFTEYFAMSTRTLNKIRETPKYILQHIAALDQDKYYEEHCKEEGQLISAGLVSYYCRDDFTYIPKRCLVFVNGKFVPDNKIEERDNYRFAILDFPEVIETVDVFYCRTDIPMMRLMHGSNQYIPKLEWQTQKLGSDKMEYINVYRKNYQGYYDVLKHDYLDNNKLVGIIDTLPDRAAYDEFKADLLRQFAQISTAGIFGSSVKDNRIIIYGGGTDRTYRMFKTTDEVQP